MASLNNHPASGAPVEPGLPVGDRAAGRSPRDRLVRAAIVAGVASLMILSPVMEGLGATNETVPVGSAIDAMDQLLAAEVARMVEPLPVGTR